MKHVTPNVFVVDDDLSMREALSSLIGLVGLHVKTFESAREFLEYHRPKSPACLVLDVRMPGMSGLALQHDLTKSGERIPIIFITGHGDIPMAVQAMKAGAIEFLQKPFRDEDLLDAIRRALERDQQYLEELAEISRVREKFDTLTPREQEVIFLIVKGALNKTVATELGVTETTVKVHRHNIMQKMKAKSLPDLSRMLEKLSASNA
jgi:FixJ family two-component response regulator